MLSSEDKNYVIQDDGRSPPNSPYFLGMGNTTTNGSGEAEMGFYLYTKETFKHNFSEIERLTYESENQSILGQVLNQRKTLETDGVITISFIITPAEL